MSKFSTIFSGYRFAVLGLSRSGLPAARALAEMGAEVLAWDDAEPARARARAEGVSVQELSERIGQCHALVLSPGIPHIFPKPHPIAAAAQRAGVPILSDAELFYRAVRKSGSRARFVGITGTNGKSTTTALLAHILKAANIPAAAGGNLGPATFSLPLLPDDGVYVLEMSSYMLERIETIRFDGAALLNLSPDHIDRHGDMAGYIAAKRTIFAHQTTDDTAVIGIDDAPSCALAGEIYGPRIVRISGEKEADIFSKDGVLFDRSAAIVALGEAKALPGVHNAQNAAAAAALAFAFGVSRNKVAEGILTFPGLAHRQEIVGKVDGVVFVNDSKATNADSAARALACYPRVIWIAGGMAKAGGITSLAPFFPRIVEALLIGRDAPLLAETLASAGVPHRVVNTLAAAVPAAFERARESGATVLFSPACASFDQFENFEARGEQFRGLVQRLAAQPEGVR